MMPKQTGCCTTLKMLGISLEGLFFLQEDAGNSNTQSRLSYGSKEKCFLVICIHFLISRFLNDFAIQPFIKRIYYVILFILLEKLFKVVGLIFYNFYFLAADLIWSLISI